MVRCPNSPSSTHFRSPEKYLKAFGPCTSETGRTRFSNRSSDTTSSTAMAWSTPSNSKTAPPATPAGSQTAVPFSSSGPVVGSEASGFRPAPPGRYNDPSMPPPPSSYVPPAGGPFQRFPTPPAPFLANQGGYTSVFRTGLIFIRPIPASDHTQIQTPAWALHTRSFDHTSNWVSQTQAYGHAQNRILAWVHPVPASGQTQIQDLVFQIRTRDHQTGPPQRLLLVADTGSNLVLVTCSTCSRRCANHSPGSAFLAHHSLQSTIFIPRSL